MICSRRHSKRPLQKLRLVALVLAAALLVPAALVAQATVHTDDGSRVVMDGGFVRIESADEEVDVDWRSGTVHVRDADDDVLVSLGAVRGADHILVPLAGDVLFEFASAAITDAAADALSELAHVIRRHAVGEVLIVGHTDSVGEDATNQRLSEQRALSVIRWLNQHESIPAHMLVGRGMGELQPVAPNRRSGRDDPEGRARNRRVEVIVGTTESADVYDIAGVTVYGDGDVDVAGVSVRDGDVDVGGVSVRGGNVHVGESAVAAAAAVGGSTTCAAGRTCEADCPDGECRMDCSAGAICDYGCSGGGCVMACASGATCEFSCDGGECRFEKGYAARLTKTCRGGGCRS